MGTAWAAPLRSPRRRTFPNILAVATIAAPFDVKHVIKLFGDKLDEIALRGEAQVNLGGTPFTIRRSFVDDLRSFDPLHTVMQLRRPLLVLHSENDQIVGVGNASAIFLGARHPKGCVSLDHADHLLTKAADADYLANMIAAWASRYLAALPEEPPVVRGDPAIVTETGAGVHMGH